LALAAEVGKEPEEKRESEAEDQASDDRKVEGCVFAAVNNVAREAAQAKRQTAIEVKQSTNENGDGAENEQYTTEFTEGVH
jgi:hypothetical protein